MTANTIWFDAVCRVSRIMAMQRVLCAELDCEEMIGWDDALLDRLSDALGLDANGHVPPPPELAGMTLTEQGQYMRRHGCWKRSPRAPSP